MFDNHNSNSSGRVEENTELSPLDEFGNPRTPNNNNNNSHNNNNNGGFFGSNNNNNNQNSGGSGGKTSLIIALIILALIGTMMFKGGDIFIGLKRLVGTPTENMNAMHNSIVDLQTVNQKEGEFDEVHDKNSIYSEHIIAEMPEKEYLVYIYTGKADLDEHFDKFVKDNQKEIPIYKMNYLDIEDNLEVKLMIELEFKPYLISYKDLGKGVKMVDTVIDEDKQLKNVPAYFKDLVAEENFTKTDFHQYEDKEENKE